MSSGVVGRFSGCFTNVFQDGVSAIGKQSPEMQLMQLEAKAKRVANRKQHGQEARAQVSEGGADTVHLSRASRPAATKSIDDVLKDAPTHIEIGLTPKGGIVEILGYRFNPKTKAFYNRKTDDYKTKSEIGKILRKLTESKKHVIVDADSGRVRYFKGYAAPFPQAYRFHPNDNKWSSTTKPLNEKSNEDVMNEYKTHLKQLEANSRPSMFMSQGTLGRVSSGKFDPKGWQVDDWAFQPHY